jgi:methanogen homoisocitrate dehydrogenase
VRIAVAPGDGIGKEVIPVARRILELLLPDAEFFGVEVGYDKWKRTGSACTDDDIRSLKDSDAILFGAVTTPPDPCYSSVLLRIRKELDLYANLRPVIGDGFDIMIVRENTEGLYSGIEEIGEERSTTLRVVTRKGSERIARCACGLAKERRNSLVIGNKANVLKSDVLFRDTCLSVADEEGVSAKTAYIDALTLDVLMHPADYDVIVTTNIFGDILSDAAGYLTGGLGMLPSANIGERYAFFEPVHGSAPDIAGKGIANPVAAIRSAAMLLSHLGRTAEADAVSNSVELTLAAGIKTPDLGGNYSTKEVGEAVMKRLSGFCP